MRAAIQGAREARALDAARTILFIDEIHRFNKAQQDALLPAIEDAVVYLIGATTENPYFEVNSALLSRCQLYRFEALPPEQVEQSRAGRARRRGARPRRPARARSSEGGLALLAEVARGDARVALNALEAAVRSRAAGRPGAGRWPSPWPTCATRPRRRPSPTTARTPTTTPSRRSSSRMRGSDPDAAVYYLASMLAGGEDPKFIARRMIVFASEDVGNADPMALQSWPSRPRGRWSSSACPSAAST